jgi:hypothetical protein
MQLISLPVKLLSAFKKGLKAHGVSSDARKTSYMAVAQSDQLMWQQIMVECNRDDLYWRILA